MTDDPSGWTVDLPLGAINPEVPTFGFLYNSKLTGFIRLNRMKFELIGETGQRQHYFYPEDSDPLSFKYNTHLGLLLRRRKAPPARKDG